MMNACLTTQLVNYKIEGNSLQVSAWVIIQTGTRDGEIRKAVLLECHYKYFLEILYL